MKIKMKETTKYRVSVPEVKEFEKGNDYEVSDIVGKALVGAGKAEEVKRGPKPKTKPVIEPEVKKVVEPEVKKTEKKEKKKADK